MDQYHQLLANNKAWVQEKLGQQPDFFQKLSSGQKPLFFMIGCNDSRKPLDTLTKTDPGQLFIHRNIANQVSSSDLSFLSALQYAVEVLEVRHIIVCGHYQCGGIQWALQPEVPELVDNWLAPIYLLRDTNLTELDDIIDNQQKADRLSELNVVQQVKNLCVTTVIKRAFQRKVYPRIHGWIFDIYTGLINEVPLPWEKWRDQGLIPVSYKLSD